MKTRRSSLGIALLWAGCAAPRVSTVDEVMVGPVVTVERQGDRFAVLAGGELFCEYLPAHEPRPILYPLLAPGGIGVTRDWPMDADAPKPHDHPHHESLWLGHGSLNGYDFWQAGAKNERIVQLVGLARVEGATAVIEGFDLWQVEEGRTIALEHRRMRFSAAGDGRRIDFTFELTAAAEPLVFGDTKEGTFALRLRPELALTGDGGAGHALNSAGDLDVWGKRAAWVDYWGPIGERTIGVALFEHPSSFRHPTWWHARDYGLFAANPFGLHDFEKKPPGAGDLTLAVGETLTLRYRLWLHEGAADREDLEREYERYAATKPE